MDNEEFQALVTSQIAENERTLNEQLKTTLTLQRKIKVDQTKAQFSAPADKRGIGFITDLQFDIQDFAGSLRGLVSEDGVKLDIEAYKDKYSEFVDSCIVFSNKLDRKLTKEAEAYWLANVSPHGWLTEKFYNQAEVFERASLDNKPFWLEEELPVEKKLSKLRFAEKEARFSKQQKK